MNGGFNVVISHRCVVRGAVVEPGACVLLSADEARALLDTGRGVLQDETDESPLQAALWEALTAVVVNAGLVVGQTAAGATAQQQQLARDARGPNPIGFIWPTTDCGKAPQT